jgi:hypothetical protein
VGITLGLHEHQEAWRSSDGSNWELSYIPQLPVGGIPNPSAQIRSLAITESGAVAVGGWKPLDGFAWKVRAAAWVSSEPGEPWREDPRRARLPSRS